MDFRVPGDVPSFARGIHASGCRFVHLERHRIDERRRLDSDNRPRRFGRGRHNHNTGKGEQSRPKHGDIIPGNRTSTLKIVFEFLSSVRFACSGRALSLSHAEISWADEAVPMADRQGGGPVPPGMKKA